MNTPPSSTTPNVYQAWIAYELAALSKTQTPAQHAALSATVFVPLKRPASPPPNQTPVTYIIARDATLDVFEIGRHTPPLAFTMFGADHAACVGRAERKVALKLASGIEEGVVLEGCSPPPNAYAVVVIEGAHPGAILVESASGRNVRLPSGIELPVLTP